MAVKNDEEDDWDECNDEDEWMALNIYSEEAIIKILQKVMMQFFSKKKGQ